MPNLARALGFLQYVTAVIALFVPLAAGLYLATTVIWTLGQRVLLRRRYPLPVPPAAPAAPA
jgi:YidC/Oxa1 family membrane protein insertase